MLLISHRGNINGKETHNENKIDYIEHAMSLGFDVEIDVFFHDKKLWLGHDSPTYLIEDINFLRNKKLWCHAKNLEALEIMTEHPQIHCFWHQNDSVTLTSKGFIWTYPNIKPLKKAILVAQHKLEIKNLPNCFGLCSDYIDHLI